MATTTTLRYPLRPTVTAAGGEEFPTEAVDYLRIQRARINYKDNKGGYKGMNMPGSETLLKNDNTTVYIAMPKNIATAYSASYAKVNMGVAGAAVSTMISGAGDQSFNDVAKTLQDAASAATPQVAASTIADATGALNQLVGGDGSGPSASDLLAVSQGRVFNPFAEQIFKEMNFRTHSFSFKFFARSMNEAKEIFNIITYLKQGAAPKIKGIDTKEFLGFLNTSNEAEGADASSVISSQTAGQLAANRFYEIPDKYRLTFVRYDPDTDKITENNSALHFKIHPSVCTNISVNYTPDGQYSSFQTVDQGAVSVPAIQLDMQFTETSVLNQGTIAQGY
ncbi:hypothetical protein CPPG_00078 [Cyanophage P-RSM1]|uniref:Baseplate tail tube cap n=1 Tax=Cyanophage P-RSM1 TaxID=536444 RepID=M4QQM2_9CAUD|nr:baseplate tail tube cap [Cyanophage P-RSM1]AGH26395.1 hypothetical protein CPPG_00078 [Cyanophage P-RSM1]